MYEIYNKKIENTLNRDIKEFNIILFSFLCITFLVGVGLASYNINSSYALFSDEINSDKVIEIEVNTPMSAARFLMKSAGRGGVGQIVHEADDTLQIGTVEDLTEYSFKGSDDVVTNNYVYFNCSDIGNQTADTCELYRIIGVFPVDDGTGNIESRVKLIRQQTSGNFWDDNGTNNWINSTLNTFYNTTYYNSLSSDYQKLIGDTKYYLGGVSNYFQTSKAMYDNERALTANTWTGKIALMYASDYAYAAGDSCTSDLNSYNKTGCYDADWLYYGKYDEWLLGVYTANTTDALIVDTKGHLSSMTVDELSTAVPESRVVFYLTPDAEFVDGDGSIDNPYQLLK